MACGTPIITTGYLPANSENAWIVPTHDGESIVQAAFEVQRIPIDQLSIKLDNANDAVREFFWPVVARKFLDEFGKSEHIYH